MIRGNTRHEFRGHVTERIGDRRGRIGEHGVFFDVVKADDRNVFRHGYPVVEKLPGSADRKLVVQADDYFRVCRIRAKDAGRRGSTTSGVGRNQIREIFSRLNSVCREGSLKRILSRPRKAVRADIPGYNGDFRVSVIAREVSCQFFYRGFFVDEHAKSVWDIGKEGICRDRGELREERRRRFARIVGCYGMGQYYQGVDRFG